ITYKGTNQVNESKISMLVHEYELFMMHDNENISEMFTRFTTIINSLKNLGKTYPNQDLVRKILRQTKKKKTMVATWSDSDYSSSDGERDGEEANIAFMEIENEEEEKVKFSFDELQTAYEKL
ncbi:UBN2 domain-containing protein, partial [Cephalotus follicularis]